MGKHQAECIDGEMDFKFSKRWIDVTTYGMIYRFTDVSGGTYCLHIQGPRVSRSKRIESVELLGLVLRMLGCAWFKIG